MFSLRNLTKYAILTLSVLSASLIKEIIMHQVYEHYKESTYISVAIMMIVTLIIFIPIIHFAGDYIEKISRQYIRSSKTITGSRRLGLFLGFSLAIFLLFILFAKLKHHLDVWGDIKRLF